MNASLRRPHHQLSVVRFIFTSPTRVCLFVCFFVSARLRAVAKAKDLAHHSREEFAVGEVGRNVVGFDSQSFAVPELGVLQLVQLEVGLAQHVVQRLRRATQKTQSEHVPSKCNGQRGKETMANDRTLGGGRHPTIGQRS